AHPASGCPRWNSRTASTPGKPRARRRRRGSHAPAAAPTRRWPRGRRGSCDGCTQPPARIRAGMRCKSPSPLLSPAKCHDPVTGYQQLMSDTAVLVIDMLNAYRHEDAEKLVPNVAEILDPMVSLISVARERDDVDLIYVNDNYGDFAADHK